ncbi:unnamed protein product [Urochloa humidicola]
MLVTVAAATSAVPIVVCGAAPAPTPTPVVGAAPTPAPVVDAGAGAVPIVFAAAAARHREAIREEARRKKNEVPWCLWTENHCCFLIMDTTEAKVDGASSSSPRDGPTPHDCSVFGIKNLQAYDSLCLPSDTEFGT